MRLYENANKTKKTKRNMIAMNQLHEYCHFYLKSFDTKSNLDLVQHIASVDLTMLS